MIELLTTTEMAEADRLTIAGGVPSMTLMENAGRAVADAVARRYPRHTPAVAVVVGPGNNGGDGYVAARLLAARGFPVRLIMVGDATKLKGDAAEAARRWTGPTEPFSAALLNGAGVIIDGLFGAGLDRPVEAAPREAIEAMNAVGAPIVAVDLPSGINGTTGAVMGQAVRANATMTFFRRKRGHLLMPGRAHCGVVEVADIGIQSSVLATIAPQASVNAPALWSDRFPVPKVEGHKYSRGHAVVASGGLTTTGAGRLAALGALRAGAGLVTIASPPNAVAINAATNLAVMVRPVAGAAELKRLLDDRRFNVIALGPGMGVGAETCDLVLAALADERAVVLDADALTSFADQPETLFTAIRARGPSPTILTPHDGEFARLFKHAQKLVENSSKCDRAKAAAEVSAATVLLKGPDTVVAAPDGRISIAENAPPWLATAGAGDVLAGVIAGLLAQGMPSFEAASAAAWLHGEAGNEAGPGLISEDLPGALRAVYRRLFVDLGAWP